LLADPLGTTITQFLDYLTVEAGLAENTRLAYGRDLTHFAMYCKAQNVTTLEHIEPNLIYSYLRTLSKERKAETTISRALVAVKMLLRFGVLTGLVPEDFTSIIEGPKRWQRLPVVCNKEKVIDLLETPTAGDTFYLRDKAVLEMLYATGMRASEVADLKISDLNFSIGYLRCLGKGKPRKRQKGAHHPPRQSRHRGNQAVSAGPPPQARQAPKPGFSFSFPHRPSDEQDRYLAHGQKIRPSRGYAP